MQACCYSFIFVLILTRSVLGDEEKLRISYDDTQTKKIKFEIGNKNYKGDDVFIIKDGFANNRTGPADIKSRNRSSLFLLLTKNKDGVLCHASLTKNESIRRNDLYETKPLKLQYCLFYTLFDHGELVIPISDEIASYVFVFSVNNSFDSPVLIEYEAQEVVKSLKAGCIIISDPASFKPMDKDSKDRDKIMLLLDYYKHYAKINLGN